MVLCLARINNLFDFCFFLKRVQNHMRDSVSIASSKSAAGNFLWEFKISNQVGRLLRKLCCGNECISVSILGTWDHWVSLYIATLKNLWIVTCQRKPGRLIEWIDLDFLTYLTGGGETVWPYPDDQKAGEKKNGCFIFFFFFLLPHNWRWWSVDLCSRRGAKRSWGWRKLKEG